jgi:multidrug resistance efflux pump/beta-lactamase regulating signal transducer with metallopeptidase domain
MVIASWMQSALWLTAGWVMLHFLWVGAAIGLVAAIGRRLLSNRPERRYVFALACFAVLVCSPAVIWICLPPNAVPGAVLPEHPIDSEAMGSRHGPPESGRLLTPALADEAAEAAPTTLSQGVLQALIQFLPCLWLMGTPCMLFLVACGVIGSERLRRQSERLLHGQLAERCQSLGQALGVRCHVGLGICGRLSTPILIGVLKPMILLPTAAVTGWSSEQLEMVLLHELAHVRRWDNVVNLCQRLVEALLFFHPVVWWLSAWIRLERESCCDQLVIAHTGNPRAYAEMLAALALPHPVGHAGALAMAENRLVVRIRRVLNLEDRSMKVSTKPLGCALGLVIAAALMVGLYAQEPRHGGTLQEPSPEAQPVPSPEQDVPRAAIPKLPPGTLPPVVLPSDPTASRPTTALPVDPTGSQQNEGEKSKQTLDQRAQVEAFEQVQLISRVAGIVSSVKVDIGDRVKRGQLLVHVDTPDLELELRQKTALVQQAKAETNQARSSVRAAQAALDATKASALEVEAGVRGAAANLQFRLKQVERLKSLLDTRAIEKSVFDEACEKLAAAEQTQAASQARTQAVKAMVDECLAKVARAEAEVQVAEARVAVADADLQRTQALLHAAQISAPFDGVVTHRAVDTGMFIPAAGQANAKPLLTVARTDIVRIVVQVPESSIAEIRTGARATVRIDALPNKQFEAKVSRFARALEPATRTMRVEIDLPNPDGLLLPGMTGVVSFRSGK